MNIFSSFFTRAPRPPVYTSLKRKRRTAPPAIAGGTPTTQERCFPSLALQAGVKVAVLVALLAATSPAISDDPATQTGKTHPSISPRISPRRNPSPLAPPKPKAANRLAKETSPYLLQHAHNPVDWYPWGDEALAKAKKEGKLIFLSVGYSSCHWCHVMERESFLDEEIAAYLNKHFVCIKVDREERPDIDSIYMTALQVYNQLAGTGRGGGWPMSMFLTPRRSRSSAGHIFPPATATAARPPVSLRWLKRVQEVWAKTPDRIRGGWQNHRQIRQDGAGVAALRRF